MLNSFCTAPRSIQLPAHRPFEIEYHAAPGLGDLMENGESEKRSQGAATHSVSETVGLANCAGVPGSAATTEFVREMRWEGAAPPEEGLIAEHLCRKLGRCP